MSIYNFTSYIQGRVGIFFFILDPHYPPSLPPSKHVPGTWYVFGFFKPYQPIYIETSIRATAKPYRRALLLVWYQILRSNLREASAHIKHIHNMYACTINTHIYMSSVCVQVCWSKKLLKKAFLTKKSVFYLFDQNELVYSAMRMVFRLQASQLF